MRPWLHLRLPGTRRGAAMNRNARRAEFMALALRAGAALRDGPSMLACASLGLVARSDRSVARGRAKCAALFVGSTVTSPPVPPLAGKATEGGT